jgi:ABC-type transport system involved in multi-copper enzyme maturation permease subunit
MLAGAPLGVDHAIAVGLIGLELMVLVAVATLFSAFTTPMLAALFTVGLWIIGHLSRDLYSLGQQSELPSVTRLSEFVFVLMPDFEVFNKTLEAVHGLPIAAGEVGLALVYALGYTASTLILGSMIFSRRDFK